MADASAANEFVKGERVSLWRRTRDLFRDVRSAWKLHTSKCPSSWICIRSEMTWCCLLLIANAVYWLFGGLLFASFEGHLNSFSHFNVV